MSTTPSDMLIRGSRLYQDLSLDHHDALYRAMTFIARRGGPTLPGDTMAVLTAHREPAQAWLLAQKEPGEILLAYERFLQRWSPVFVDASAG